MWEKKKKYSAMIALITALGITGILSQDGIFAQEKGLGNNEATDISVLATVTNNSTDDAFNDYGVATKAIKDALSAYEFTNETTEQEILDYLNHEFVETGKLFNIDILGFDKMVATKDDIGSVTITYVYALISDHVFMMNDIKLTIPRLPKDGEVAINSVNFPDEKFRSYVAKKWDTDKDQILSVLELSKVKDIVVTKKEVANTLKGIENFTSLKSLRCGGTDITELDTSSFTQLKYLTCDNTKIKRLDLHNNINLINLYCDDADLEYLNISNSAYLEDLSCTYNERLTTIDVTNNRKLISLKFNYTGITSIDLKENKNLRTLWCTNTPIRALKLSDNKELKSLMCYSSKITTLDLSECTKLEQLLCGDCPLQWVNLGDNPNLTVGGLSSQLTLDIIGNTFDITNLSPNIDLNKVKINYNGKLNGNIVTLDSADFMIYSYDCGSGKNGKQFLNVNVNLNVKKLPSTIEITDILDNDKINYTGNNIPEPKYTVVGSKGKVSYLWEERIGNGWRNMQNPPIDAGRYRVTAKVASDSFYEEASSQKEFNIIQVNNNWINALDIIDWTYGDKASQPTAAAKFGDVIFTYSDARDGVFTSDVPSTAGIWYVKAEVLENGNYKGLEDVKEFKITKANTNIMITKELDKVYDGKKVNIDKDIKVTGSTGAVSYRWEKLNGTVWNPSSIPTDVGKYRVIVNVEEDLNHIPANRIKEFEITKANNGWTKELNIADWKYGEQANDPTAIAKFGSVVFTYSDAKDGVFINDVPSMAGTWYVKAEVLENKNYKGLIDVKEFKITKTDTDITITKELDKVYDGKEVNIDKDIKVTGSTGAMSYQWEKQNGTVWNPSSIPTDVGKYRVIVNVEEDLNHIPANRIKEFEITKAMNTWTSDLKITDWTYGDKANEPTASSEFGDVIFTYSNHEQGDFKKEVPNTAGTWYVKAEVLENKNYKGLKDVKAFNITKAMNSWTSDLKIGDWTYGDKANEPTASSKFGDVIFTYSDREQGDFKKEVPNTAGTWFVKAHVSETTNYAGLDKIQSFVIKKKNIKEKDIYISDIKNAKDVENIVIKDGNIVLVNGQDYDIDSKEEVDKITVTIRFKGNYDGTVIKTYSKDVEKPKDTNQIDTGDYSQVGLLGIMSIISIGCLALLIGKRKKTQK